MFDWRRPRLALVMLTGVFVLGTIGYVILGFSVLDAVYQTVTTVATVGFREVQPLDDVGKVFTIVLILVGVGTALYTFSVVLETLLEGHLSRLFGRRRMERQIEAMRGPRHRVRLGPRRSSHRRRARGCERRLGRRRSRSEPAGRLRTARAWSATPPRTGSSSRPGSGELAALVAALDNDAANLFVTLSARALCPDLFIVARARLEESEEKLRRAGADRVVNPQSIGGARIAAFVLQPNVTEFLDVVMHDRSLQFRLEEVLVPAGSAIAGQTIRNAHLRDRTGAARPRPARGGRLLQHQPVAGHDDPTRSGAHRHRDARRSSSALERTVEVSGGEVPSVT